MCRDWNRLKSLLVLCLLPKKMDQMRKQLILITFIAAVIAGCTESGQKDGVQEGKTPPAVESKPIGAPEEGINKATDIDLDRFAMNSPELGTFGILLNKSTWPEKLKGTNVTFLCPTDASLKNFNTSMLSQLKKKENLDVLNKFIGGHLIKEELTYETIFRLREIETANGNVYQADSASSTIAGVSCSKKEIKTKGGTIILVDGVLGMNSDQLKEAILGKK